jgi:hypothetical protein
MYTRRHHGHHACVSIYFAWQLIALAALYTKL